MVGCHPLIVSSLSTASPPALSPSVDLSTVRVQKSASGQLWITRLYSGILNIEAAKTAVPALDLINITIGV